MNCQHFESTVNDLARGRLVEARVRDAADEHAASCARCAARLADEHALSAGLHGLASAQASIETPARVETALLAAFRAQRGSGPRVAEVAEVTEVTCAEDDALAARTPAQPLAQSPEIAPVAPANPVALPQARRWSWRGTIGIAVTAAAAAVMLVMLIPVEVRVTNRGQVAEASKARNEMSRRPLESGTSAPQVNAPQMEPTVGMRDDGPSALASFASHESDSRAVSRSSRPVRMGNVAARAGRAVPTSEDGYATGSFDSGTSARSIAETSETGEPSEVATDFIPLMHGRLASGDGGQVVRVELPRSALVRFGLPMNVERASERVKADVLLGEDGTARAIRFVR